MPGILTPDEHSTNRPDDQLGDDVLRGTVDDAPDGVLIVDESGTIRYANTAIAVISGHGTNELVGMNVEELLPNNLRVHHRRLRDGFNIRPTRRAMGQGLNLTLQRRDGTMVAVEISLSPMTSHGEAFVIAAVRDISERLDAEQRLQSAREQLALAAERDRIGRELHDTVLQRLYGLGLQLQATGQPDSVVDEIDRIIAEIRTAVFTLGTASRPGSLGQELADVVAQSRRLLGFSPRIRLDGPVATIITPLVRGELVASMREALGNIARHANATEATVTLRTTGDGIEMWVDDNGTGPPPDVDAALTGGHGLRNLDKRAALLGGWCRLEPRQGGGSRLRWFALLSDE